MKKVLATILAFVYLLVAIPAIYGQSDCEGGCEEVKQIKTEDHQRTMTSFVKLDPLAPVAALRSGQVQVDAGEVFSTGLYVCFPFNKIPLFVRHCNFRI